MHKMWCDAILIPLLLSLMEFVVASVWLLVKGLGKWLYKFTSVLHSLKYFYLYDSIFDVMRWILFLLSLSMIHMILLSTLWSFDPIVKYSVY